MTKKKEIELMRIQAALYRGVAIELESRVLEINMEIQRIKKQKKPTKRSPAPTIKSLRLNEQAAAIKQSRENSSRYKKKGKK